MSQDPKDLEIQNLKEQIAGLHQAFEEQIVIRTLELEQARDQALLESKNKSQFLANISHEIRTPLNGIINFAELLNKTTLTEEQKRYLNFMKESSNMLSAILGDILDFSKSAAGKMTLHPSISSVKDIFENTVNHFKPEIEKKALKLEVIVSDKMPDYLIVDKVRLQQIMMNLLSNAVKFTYAGSISAHLLYHPNSDYQFELCVVDTGIGIPETKLGEIFNPFTQLDNSDTRVYGGTGLGLSIVKEIVQEMKGKIEVNSESRKGATFKVLWNAEIPKDIPTEMKTSKNSNNTTEKLDKPKKILLVEDMQINREIVKAFLEMEGCEVHEAQNGAEAVDMYQQRGSFDLILMDCQMPVMDGFEATEEILRMASPAQRPPIVALTASALNETRERCMNAGMVDFITKPIQWEVLRKVVGNSY